MWRPRVPLNAVGGSRLARAGVVATGVALGILGFALYHTMRGSVQHNAQPTSVARSASPVGPRILGWSGRGLNITEVVDGRPVYSLKVERVRFEPAHLGFLRVGFLQSPVLEDARLAVYTRDGTPGSSTHAEAVEAALVGLLRRQDMLNLGWMGGFIGVNASPLRVQLIRDGREILALASERASVDLRHRQLDLEGQVRLSADGGARILESDRLRFSLRAQEVWTDSEVRLRTPEGHAQQQGFRGDVFLRTIALRPAGPREATSGQDQAVSRAGEELRP